MPPDSKRSNTRAYSVAVADRCPGTTGNTCSSCWLFTESLCESCSITLGLKCVFIDGLVRSSCCCIPSRGQPPHSSLSPTETSSSFSSRSNTTGSISACRQACKRRKQTESRFRMDLPVQCSSCLGWRHFHSALATASRRRRPTDRASESRHAAETDSGQAMIAEQPSVLARHRWDALTIAESHPRRKDSSPAGCHHHGRLFACHSLLFVYDACCRLTSVTLPLLPTPAVPRTATDDPASAQLPTASVPPRERKQHGSYGLFAREPPWSRGS
jgi:hypothetical protein